MRELEAARRVAIRAGRLLERNQARPRSIRLKAGAGNLVTDMDHASEELIVRALRREFPDHAIVAEESGNTGDSSHRWYIDPLDGTTNFAHGYPQFAVSIALAREDDLLLGVVYDPVREELFTALRGDGARLNGAPITLSPVDQLGRALLATGFPYDHRQHIDFHLSFWREALQHAQGVRRAGAAALDLCYVACGRLDGFWEWNLHPWDLAAGRLIIEEAGGLVTDATGGPHRLSGEETVASNGRIHGELLAMIARARQR